ncbi:MAG TPA: hypothetical protein VIS96_02865 [Terrimicrobiaceae bacterium]
MNNAMPLAAAMEGGITVRGFDAALYLDGLHNAFLLPTYVRAGAILPTIELEQFVGQRNWNGQANPVTFNVYSGRRWPVHDVPGRWREPFLCAGQGRRGGGDPAAKSEYREVRITQTYINPRSRQIRIERLHDGYTPRFEDYFFVAILHDPSEAGAPSTILLDGTALRLISGGSPESRADELASSSSSAWYYNENVRISFAKILDQAAPIVLGVH